MNKLYCGIDPSLSSTAIVILDDTSKVTSKTIIKTKPLNNQRSDVIRIVTIRNGLEFLKEHKDIKVCIEGISFGSKGSGADALAALNYVIQIFLHENNIPYDIVPPSKLKKFVCGNGQAKKNIMLKEIYKRWGEDFNSDDIGDAYSLARFLYENCKIEEKKNKKII